MPVEGLRGQPGSLLITSADREALRQILVFYSCILFPLKVSACPSASTETAVQDLSVSESQYVRSLLTKIYHPGASSLSFIRKGTIQSTERLKNQTLSTANLVSWKGLAALFLPLSLLQFKDLGYRIWVCKFLSAYFESGHSFFLTQYSYRDQRIRLIQIPNVTYMWVYCVWPYLWVHTDISLLARVNVECKCASVWESLHTHSGKCKCVGQCT